VSAWKMCLKKKTKNDNRRKSQEPWFESDPLESTLRALFEEGAAHSGRRAVAKGTLPVATVPRSLAHNSDQRSGMRALGLLVDKPANCHCSCNQLRL